MNNSGEEVKSFLEKSHSWVKIQDGSTYFNHGEQRDFTCTYLKSQTMMFVDIISTRDNTLIAITKGVSTEQGTKRQAVLVAPTNYLTDLESFKKLIKSYE